MEKPQNLANLYGKLRTIKHHRTPKPKPTKKIIPNL